MERIKRFIDVGLQLDSCNFSCHYCYIGQQKHDMGFKINDVTRTPEEVRNALSKERLGGVCLINFCAVGETLLSKSLLPIIEALLDEGHYIMIVTNGTIRSQLQAIADWNSERKSRVFLKFSLHYLELLRKGMLNQFADNVRTMKEQQVSFTVEIVPSDELVPYIPELKSFCMDKFGALCHVTVARDESTEEFKILTALEMDDYDKIWGQFESGFFEYKRSTFLVKRKEFCYAGEWSFSLNLQTGDYRKCTYEDKIGNIYEQIDKPLHFSAVGCGCKMPHCYNSHAYLVLGLIPELSAPTMADIRNRVCSDGSEWLQPCMKEIMGQKLSDNNQKYGWGKKAKIYARVFGKTMKESKLYQGLRRVKHKLVR